MAIEAALDGIPPDKDFILFTDSEYCLLALTVWHKRWEAANWRNQKGHLILNRVLIERVILKLRHKPNVEIRWVKAH